VASARSLALDSKIKMAAALQITAPRVIGRYVLYGAIASGGMATVHFGRLMGPAGFARPVAIKRLHEQFARDPDFVKMFFDEARLAARIAHPNVVATLDVVAPDDEVFLVMEYVRGVALVQLIRNLNQRGQKLPPLIAVGIMVGVLHGLHAAHEATNDRGESLNLVHRDVSPQNVLVGTDGVPRLLDFGVAAASGRAQSTRDGQLKGKLAYMAPEQVRAEQPTRRTDVFAASVVLWEMLTGKRLFYAANEASVLARVLNAEIPAPSSIATDLPKAFDRVVARGLERDPAKRYPTARDMANDLGSIIGVASATEIGEWVERTAAEELRQRAATIAQIERMAAEAGDLTKDLGGDEGTASPGRSGTREILSNIWRQSTKTGVGTDRSVIPGVSVGSSDAPPAPSRRLAIALGVGACAIALVLVLVLSLRTRTGGGSANASPLVAATPSETVPPVRVNVEDLPRAPATATTAEPELEMPATPPPPPVQHPKSGSSTPRSPAKAPARADDDCNPPYTADANGHIHFKPSCM
jgi:eukaryotic-like serine/threonine-protein kinase